MTQPHGNLTAEHVILENGDQLAIDAATAQYLVVFGLIYEQGDDLAANHYHIVEPRTWADVEGAIASFNDRALSKRTVEAAVAEGAADAFWAQVVIGFPEMTTGDTQLTDEDVGAFYLWLTGVEGAYAYNPVGLIPCNVPLTRIDAVLAGAIAASHAVLMRLNPALPTASAAVVSTLRGCLHLQLHWNFPSETTSGKHAGRASVAEPGCRRA